MNAALFPDYGVRCQPTVSAVYCPRCREKAQQAQARVGNPCPCCHLLQKKCRQITLLGRFDCSMAPAITLLDNMAERSDRRRPAPKPGQSLFQRGGREPASAP
jgi:hypothetical protein